MMRYLFTVLLFAPLAVSAQLSVSASTGYGFYAMRDLKTFQASLKKDFPVDAKITASYPAFPYFEGAVTKVVEDRLLVGGSFSYASTGGRIYYSDYSGMIASDQLLTSYALNASFGMTRAFMRGKLVLAADLRPGFMITDLKLIFDQAIGTQTDRETLKFQSVSVVIQPTLSLIKRFSYFGVHMRAGYHLTPVPGKLFFKDQDEAYLIDDSERPIYADWAGLRLAAGINIYFEKVEKAVDDGFLKGHDFQYSL